MRLVKQVPVLAALLLGACGVGASPEASRKANGNIADIALNAGSPDVALRLSDEVLAKQPADADALVRRGQALTDLGQLDQARESLHRAVSMQPDNARALVALGRVELPVDPAAAEAAFEAALKQDSHSAIALNNLGIARDLQGHHVAAEAAYRSAITIQPNMTAAQVNLALCLAMRGQGMDAIRVIQPLADAQDATAKIKQDYAAVLAMAGQRQAAERILSTTLAANDIPSALDALTMARGGLPGDGRAPLAQLAPAAPVPVRTAALPVASPAADPIAAPPSPEHRAMIELGELDSEMAARDKWRELSQRFPEILNGRKPVFSTVERHGHIIWRVKASGFPDVARAASVCDVLRPAIAGCSAFDS